MKHVTLDHRVVSLGIEITLKTKKDFQNSSEEANGFIELPVRDQADQE